VAVAAAAASQAPPWARSLVALGIEHQVSLARPATAVRLVEGGHSPAPLVCHGIARRKWFTRGADVPSRWFPKDDLDADGFAFGVLHAGKPDDTMPRKIGADAWFDRWEAQKYEVQEQTIRTTTDEVLTLILITASEMLEDGR